MATEIGSPPRFFHMPRFQHQAPRQLFYKRPDFAQQQAMQQLTFDGKRMRKAVNRKTIDYNPSVIKYLEVSLINVPQMTKLWCLKKKKVFKVQGNDHFCGF